MSKTEIAEFDLRNLTAESLKSLAGHYHQSGFVVLTGMEEITELFPQVLAEATGLQKAEMENLLDPENSGLLSLDLRGRLAKVNTTPALAQSLLKRMKPILLQLLGPIIHVSSTFHAQFKGKGVGQIDYPGFHAETEYVEIHGPHLLHQDFPAAILPISPSMITLWVALNTTTSWKLRLYPGSHHTGIVCNKFLEPDDHKLQYFQREVDITARRGSAILFNGMTLHGTGDAGPGRRASCDIRFFPLTGFLPSEPHLLDPNPFAFLIQKFRDEKDSTLLAPLYQDLVFLGKTNLPEKVMRDMKDEPYSHLHWIPYLTATIQGNHEEASHFLQKLVNREIGIDDPFYVVKKYRDHTIHAQTLRIVREKIALALDGTPELRELDELIRKLEAEA